MKDDFLYQLRQEPGPNLSRAVYRNIASLPGDEFAPDSATASDVVRASFVARTHRRRVVALAALAALVLFAISSVASPSVRAIVEDIVHQIGGLRVRETSIYPLSGDKITVTESVQYLSLEEARQAVDFEFRLPTELPARYALLEEVILSSGGGSVSIRWQGTETRGDSLWLRVSRANPDVNYLVGSGSIERIEINGQEAVFVRGGWLENTESWDPNIGREVRWVHDGVAYHLSTGGQFLCPDAPELRCPLSDEDLIRIAESVN